MRTEWHAERMRDPLSVDTPTRRAVGIDAAVAVAFGLIAVSIHLSQSANAGIAAGMIAAALACRRVAPTLMTLLAVASAVFQVVTGDIAVVASVAYAVVFYTLGGNPDRRVRIGALALAVAGSVVAGWELPRVLGGGTETGAGEDLIAALLSTGMTALVVVGGWAAGFIRYQRRSVEAARVAETIAGLERRRVLDLYDEQARRTRLARDMHDVVAHSLAVVVAQAEGARYTIDASPDAARDALGVIADTARGALTDVRTLLEQLRAGDPAPLATRIEREQLLTRMRAAGMTIDDHVTGDPDGIDPAVGRALFRILTEALTNALKYGDLDRPVQVRQDISDGVRMTVRNAIGTAPLAPGGAGHGITGMIERAALVDGTLTSAATDSGWSVELVIPARQEGA